MSRAAAIAVALLLAGCGIKGDPQPVDGGFQKDTGVFEREDRVL